MAASLPLAGRFAGWLAVGASLVSAAFAVVTPAGSLVLGSWIPEAGVDWSFMLDGWSRLFWLLISGIGIVIKLFAMGYLKDRHAEFFRLITVFELAMLGVVLSRDLVAMFLFWELTTYCSFLLINWSRSEASSKAAMRAWWFTGLPGLVMLVGIIGLKSTGVHTVSELASYQGAEWPMWLILVGCLAKSAQAPLHAWLPGTMVAPAPVSAYLHSATMVKAGVYLAARMVPALSSETLQALAFIGFGTLVFAGVLTLFQSDVKRILAYTTVAALGWMMGLIGLGTDAALHALVGVVVAHALYKSALFLAAGSIEKAFGTRELGAISGWGRAIPNAFVAVVLAAVSMVGFPTTLGFMAKELSLKAIGLGEPLFWAFALGQCVMIGAPFALLARARGVGEPRRLPVLLGVAVIPAAVGVVAAWFFAPLFNESAGALMDAGSKSPGFLPWYGLKPEFWASSVLLVVGPLVALGVAKIRATGPELAPAETALQRFLDGLLDFSQRVTRLSQSGSLRIYVRTLLVFIALLVCTELVALPWPAITSAPNPSDVTLVIVGGMAAVAALRARSRLGSILAAGGVGVVVTSIFALYSATDVALTNLVTEILTLILFAVMLTHLPRYRRISLKRQRSRDTTFSIACGLAFAGLVFVFSAPPFGSAVSDFYIANSQEGAKALNLVNAILVDFRALDTLGEVAVLAGALVGVVVLIRATRPAQPQEVP